MAQAILPSPIGTIIIDCDERQLLSLAIQADGEVAARGKGEGNALSREAARQIEAYFARQLRDFDLPLAPLTSPRGEALRAAIRSIPFGESASYGELARAIGSGPRAIGQACRRNPLPIIVACHRVTTGTGALGHYSAGSGARTKRWLLDHETARRLL